MHHIFFTHLSTGGHSVGFLGLAIVNSAAVNICVQISQDPVYNSLGLNFNLSVCDGRGMERILLETRNHHRPLFNWKRKGLGS